jgi:DegV family protein with EDD domain
MAAELGIRVVPIYVRFGDKTYRDGLDITPGEFYSKLLSSKVHPATSQPSPQDFSVVYKDYSETRDGIISVHISSKISGTFNSAWLAKKDAGLKCPVEVIDSKMNSAGLGLVVIAAARKANSGGSFYEVVTEANRAIDEVRMFGMFETMLYLARGGRVNKATAAVSKFLHVMPLLTFKDGEIVRAGLVRTIKKGTDRVYEFIKNNMPVSETVVVHSGVPERANHLKELIEGISKAPVSIWELGSGLGVHGGPGVLLAAIRKQMKDN